MKGELAMLKKTVFVTILVFLSAIVLLACAGDNKPAELALKAAEEAVNTARTEAVKYVPDQMQSLEDSLAAVKDKFAKKEYQAVITEAKDLAGKAKEVLEAAKLKKEEMTASWTNLSQELPKMVETMQGKVDLLSKSKKLPADLTTEKFDEAKAGLAAVKEEWAKAMESFNAGRVADAVNSANAIKEKAMRTMGILGLAAPAAESAAAPAPAAETPAPAAAEPAAAAVETKDGADKGDKTQWLQNALNQLGADPKLTVDGRFGPATRRAVMKFQTTAGIPADGKAGPATEAAIKEKLAKVR